MSVGHTLDVRMLNQCAILRMYATSYALSTVVCALSRGHKVLWIKMHVCRHFQNLCNNSYSCMWSIRKSKKKGKNTYSVRVGPNRVYETLQPCVRLYTQKNCNIVCIYDYRTYNLSFLLLLTFQMQWHSITPLALCIVTLCWGINLTVFMMGSCT